MNPLALTGAFLVCFTLYWWLLARLVTGILDGPRLKPAHWLLLGAANAAVLFFVWSLCSSIILCYCVMMALMLLEFLLFFKDRFSAALLCTLACCLHVLGLFMICIGTLSVHTGRAPYEILSDSTALMLCCAVMFFILDFVVAIVLVVVPVAMVKLINQHQEQQLFMNAWMAVSCLYLLYMEHWFHIPTYGAPLAGSQIAAAAALLLGVYIVLFFSIKTSSLLGYKEKNAALQQAIQLEQQYRSNMARDAIASYEVNVTRDLFLKGFEEHRREMGEAAFRYSDMLVLMAQKLIFSEDISDFVRNHGRTNILRLFEKGDRELIAEYRRLLESGEYIWVRAVINLVRDMETGDVKAFVCVKNIDEEKKKQLELQRLAERDPLTGLYNRSTAIKLIDEHLAFTDHPTGSALFMVDVDNFKDVNDNLGHIYGDAVLCELADKLKSIFRVSDIVGRIGGDEFIVLLKDGSIPPAVQEKAAEICRAFQLSYQGPDETKYAISASVGISFFPGDGTNFNELYAYADIALYAAKGEGKNSYRLYDGRSFSGYSSHRTEIQSYGNVSQKGFRENRIEYVFKMLYQSESPVAAIHAVLELVARHFSFERGYIFETSKDGKTSSNTFEWCAEGVHPEIDNLQELPIAAVATAHSHFQKSGTFVLKSLDDLPPLERAVLEPQGIKSMFQFGIFDKSRLLGFIGFDNCRSESIPSDIDVDEMKTICNILATFFVKQYIDEVSARDLLARQEVMNHLENYIYVINTETFEILFMNEKIHMLLQSAEDGAFCYSFFRGETAQCQDCPLRQLVQGKHDRAVCEMYNEKLGIWMETSASLMRWTDGSLACLINCSDITKQKQAHLSHVQELEQLIYVDSLVGCPTYPKFQMEAQRILREHPDDLHLLVKLDIANFKLINQIYGYERGNEVLSCVAAALTYITREHEEFFARVANDEFVVLFTLAGREQAEQLNQRFLSHFQTLVGSDFSFQCRFPHGRYIIDPVADRDSDIKDLYEKANMAHKMAKLNKAVEYTFYDEAMTREALRVKSIENKMEDALQSGNFSVYLQPKYHLQTETIGGAEALTRWENETEEVFFPGSFIPVFEQNGFITKLDFHVFETVCNTIRAWMDRGIEPVTVSVNFSRLHLDNPNFVKRLCAIADNVGVTHKYLEIEITETAIFENIDMLEKLLMQLHESGFTMSMDDFGSGYSSLGMLKDFPVDVIKMDRSFFADQRDTERSKTVVGSVIDMAAKLDIRIVAEGVEEQEHINFLRELNCDMVQGYYYAKPMPTAQFTQLLRKEREIET